MVADDGQDSGGFAAAGGRVHNLGAIMQCPPNAAPCYPNSTMCNNITAWVAVITKGNSPLPVLSRSFSDGLLVVPEPQHRVGRLQRDATGGAVAAVAVHGTRGRLRLPESERRQALELG